MHFTWRFTLGLKFISNQPDMAMSVQTDLISLLVGSAMLRYAREQLATEPTVGTAVCTAIQGLPVATCRTEQPKKHS